MCRMTGAVGLAALGAVFALGSEAQPAVNVSAQLDFGIRSHFDDGRYAGQRDAGHKFFLGVDFEATSQAGDGDLTFRFHGLEDSDGARSVANLQAAHYTQAFDSWDLLVGVDIRNWGVAESQSVLNVLNPRDTTDVIYGGAFVGTPMVNANFTTALGTFSGFALLGFIPPNLPGHATRQRAPWAAAPTRAIYQEGNGRHTDFALRWSDNYILATGGLDLSASYFDGTSRTPVSLPGCAGPTGPVTYAACDAINDAIVNAYISGNLDPGGDLYDLLDGLPDEIAETLLTTASGLPGVGLVPYYPHIRQAGFSSVFASGDLQLRAEAAFTKPEDMDGHWSGVAGGDYSFHGLGPTDATLTLVAEYLWDDRGTRSFIFGNDLFLGLNLLLNDRRDTRLQAGGFYDLDTYAQLYQISASTRIDDQVRLEFNALHVKAGTATDPLSFIDRDNFLELKISTYF